MVEHNIYMLKKFIFRFFSQLFAKHIHSLEKLAHKRGYQDGLKAGYTNGLTDGKDIWVIDDQRPTAVPQPINNSIYGPDRFTVTDQLRQLMIEEVAEAVKQKIVDSPSPEQWKMILSDHPATCVVAGAGSGKSTTLVLRVAFMLVHLGIPKEEITVVSFTRSSCDELRRKMLNILTYWEYPIDKNQVSGLVRTFHSSLYKMSTRLLPGMQWFENIKDNETDTEEDGDIENPFASSKLNNAQIQLLKDTYIELYNQNETFRRHVLLMLKKECDRDINDGKTPESEYKIGILKIAHERDEKLVKKVNQDWAQKGLWPIDGVEEGPHRCLTAEGFIFFANGKIIANGLPIFLGNYGIVDDNEKLGDNEGNNSIELYRALIVKKNILTKYYDGQHLYINNHHAIDRLGWRIKYFSSTISPQKAPMFDIQLTGELGPSSIYEAFYTQASFIESLNLEVPVAIEKMRPYASKCLEYHFGYALALFWPFFETRLHNNQPKILTFNRGFLLLGERSGANLSKTNQNDLRAFTHLLIDEFQDISPQIVSWIRACQRRLVEFDKQPSIMAIGDDWQSIYGWRGSSPDFFIHFDKHFPIHESLDGANICEMMENYRSIEPILKHAECILYKIENKIKKNAKSKKEMMPDDHGVKLFTQKNIKANIDEISIFIMEQYEKIKNTKNTDKNKLIVLARTNNTINMLRKKIGQKKGILFHTYHGSKGLQGEIAVLCEDCHYNAEHPFRNRIYKCAGIFTHNTYDEAMHDEAYRLAYVAITRGIRRVYWYVDEAKGAAKILHDAVN